MENRVHRMHRAVRAVVFDYGGVLMRTVDRGPRRAWDRQLGLPEGAVDQAVFGHPTWDAVQTGRMSPASFWAGVGHRLGLDEAQTQDFRHAFWAGDQLDVELAELIRQLRSTGYRTGLLSNAPAGLAQHLEELGLLDIFDTVVISGSHGVMKPDPAIYRLALDDLGVRPAEAIFVDDFRVNVAAARALGMPAVLFLQTERFDVRSDLRRLGVRVPGYAPDIRAVIFDWGGVLQHLPRGEWDRDWERRLGLAENALPGILWGETWKQLELGAITQEDFDLYLASALGLPDRNAVLDFYRDYYAGEYVDERIVAAVRDLRRHGYRVALLTNAFVGQDELMLRKFDFDVHREFDVYVNSAEVNLAKPDPAVYALALKQLDVEPDQAVFVDDLERNTEAARALGIHAIQDVDTAQALWELENLLGHRIARSDDPVQT